eukprot:1410364-Amphidinium_carterae.1
MQSHAKLGKCSSESHYIILAFQAWKANENKRTAEINNVSLETFCPQEFLACLGVDFCSYVLGQFPFFWFLNMLRAVSFENTPYANRFHHGHWVACYTFNADSCSNNCQNCPMTTGSSQ